MSTILVKKLGVESASEFSMLIERSRIRWQPKAATSRLELNARAGGSDIQT